MPEEERDVVEAHAFADSKFGWQAVGRLRTGFKRSRNPMLLADDHRRWVTANPAACELLGVREDEVPWRRMDEFTPPEEHQRLEEEWAAFLEGGEAEGDYDLYVEDRGAIPVEFSATANVLPSRHLAVFLLRDVIDDDEEVRPVARWAAVAARPHAESRLSAREREIMTMVASGFRSEEMAEQLFLSSSTIKSHVANAMSKLGVHTRAHAVAVALVTGEISWDLL